MQNNEIVIYIDRDKVLSDVLEDIARKLQIDSSRNIRIVRPELNVIDVNLKKDYWWRDPDIIKCTIMCITTRTHITDEIMRECKYLKACIYPTIGWNTIDRSAATQNKIMIVNNPTWENYSGLAEATVMLMSALSLELQLKIEQCRKNSPRPEPNKVTSCMLANKKIGLIGYGRIAKEVKRRLAAWGCDEILVYSRNPDLVTDRDVTVSSMEHIFETADVISIHTPLTPETKHLINYNLMCSTKNGFFLINTARGGVVCEDSLIRALNEGIIKGAALDVFEEEPLLLNHPLRNYQNVILTNHIVGHTRELFNSLSPGVIASIEDVLKNKIPVNCINFNEQVAKV